VIERIDPLIIEAVGAIGGAVERHSHTRSLRLRRGGQQCLGRLLQLQTHRVRRTDRRTGGLDVGHADEGFVRDILEQTAPPARLDHVDEQGSSPTPRYRADVDPVTTRLVQHGVPGRIGTDDPDEADRGAERTQPDGLVRALPAEQLASLGYASAATGVGQAVYT
jgi:hypothetical protein